MKEEWRPVPGYEGLYEVSNQGRIKSLSRKVISRNRNCGMMEMRLPERVLKGYIKQGVPTAYLFKNGQYKSVFISHLVAQAFVANPENLYRVGHHNSILTDNRDKNLFWYKTDLPHKVREAALRPVVQYDRENKRIAEYQSIIEAAQSTAVSSANIGHCLKGERASAGGYYWRYTQEEKRTAENGAIVCKYCKRIWPKLCKWHSPKGASL